MTQLSAVSSARIKLKTRHRLEWQTLATLQQTVWQSVSEKFTHELASCSDDQVGRFHLKKQQCARFTTLLDGQREVRQHLKARHQKELLALEQSV